MNQTRSDIMVEQSEVIQQARALPKEKRKEILMFFKETELHQHLKTLLMKMAPDASIEITHGVGEYGKDLVMVQENRFGRTVVGIVVKMGDIRGKTLGKVDEIKSQVEQAFDHPAKLKTFVEDLSISEVWIMLAGELSQNARQRLKKELKTRNIRIFDIGWLIDNFTDYYPQVYFEGQLLDFIQQKIQELETKHMFSKRGKNLSECFVEPIVRTSEIPAIFDEKNFLLSIKNIEGQKLPFSKLKSVFPSHTKIILTGSPGTGKSMALAKLTIDMLKKASTFIIQGVSEREIKIPILLLANKLEEFTDYEMLCKKYIPPEILDRFKISEILIDGLDEVQPSKRQCVLEKAQEFAAQLNCSLIVATRKIDIIKTPPPEFVEYELLPFEFGQALKLFEKLVTSKQTLDTLKDGLERIKHQIAMTPLSLILLIELVESYKEIPASIAELYERFSDIVLGRFDKEKGIEVLFEYFIKKRFLAELAFKEFLEKNKLEIPKREFDEFLSNYANRYGWDEASLTRFVKEIERAGLLHLRETVTFQHRSFLDYFAAFYIYDKREEIKDLGDFVTQIYFKDIWGDVAFFYVGMKKDITNSMLKKILTFEKEDLSICVDKFLIGRLLQAAWHSPSKTKLFGVKKAIAFAPAIRTKFLKITESSKITIPKIFADFIVVALSDFSFASTFLFKEVKSLFDVFLDRLSGDNLYTVLLLLWAIQRFLNPTEVRETIIKFLENVSKIPDLSVEEQTRVFLVLEIIAKQNKAIIKTIKRKLDKLAARYPEVFRELVPHKKKGFR